MVFSEIHGPRGVRQQVCQKCAITSPLVLHWHVSAPEFVRQPSRPANRSDVDRVLFKMFNSHLWVLHPW